MERLNTFQPTVETITPQIHLILRYRIEHERVIGIGGMPQGKDFSALHCNAVHENVGSVRSLCWSGSDGIKIDYDLPRSADFSATGRIRCGEQVCCIAGFQTRVVLDKFNALTNALPIWKSAIRQVRHGGFVLWRIWKPALRRGLAGAPPPLKTKQPPRGFARRLIVQKALTSLQRSLHSFIDSPLLAAPASSVQPGRSLCRLEWPAV
jgi:hypothetical protein